MDSSRFTRIELFAFHTRPSFLYSPIQSGCWYLILRLTCGEKISYGECMVAMNRKSIDLIKWGDFLRDIRSSTLKEAFEVMNQQRHKWSPFQLTLLQSALTGMLQNQYSWLDIALGSHYTHNYGPCNKGSYYRTLRSCDDVMSNRLFDESIAYFSLI